MRHTLKTIAMLLVACTCTADPMPAGASYAYAFSPKGHALQLVLQGIEGAQHEILVATYSFTSTPISLALLDAHKRGVKVRVVSDQAANRKFTAAQFLANKGVPVRLNGAYAIHHHKFMVIDGIDIETGSFNYSASAAEKNAENVLVIRGVPDLAKGYAQEWQRLWNEAKELPAKY